MSKKETQLVEKGNGHTLKVSAEDEDDTPTDDGCRAWGICAFVVNFSVAYLFVFVPMVYTTGCIRTIEKRFGLSSTKTGFLMSVNDVAHICVVMIIGYIGRRAHKPRFLCINMLLNIVGCLLMALPYFLYGKDPIPLPSGISELYNLTLSPSDNGGGEFAVCDAESGNTEICIDKDEINENENVYYIMIVAQILFGIGGSGMSTLSMAYIDENAPPKRTPLYFGALTSVFGLGPIGGLLLAALCTRLPENLQATDMKPTDPNWIGAWWLGYLICSAGIFVTAVPLFFYPKKQPYRRHLDAKRKAGRKVPETKTILEQIKGFPVALIKVLSNKPYMCLLGCFVSGAYVIQIFINIPRYLEIHFHQPAFLANVVAAVPALSSILGAALGGVLMSRLMFRPLGIAKFMVFSGLFFTGGFVIATFLSCPQLHMGGDMMPDTGELTVDTACNANCSCVTDKSSYRPVCGSDDVTYFSACHAGCTTHSPDNGTFVDCHCIGDSGGGSARPGLCVEPCNKIWPFTIAILVGTMVSSINRVPTTVLQLRLVEEDEKAFVLSVSSFAFNALAMIPGPLLFGTIIDSTCLLWQRTCDVIGNCLHFDTAQFRLRVFGTGDTFMMISVMFSVLLVLSLRNRDDLNKDQEAETKEVKAESVPLSQDCNSNPVV